MPTKCRIEYSKGQFGFFLKGIFYFLKMEKKKKIIKINIYKKKKPQDLAAQILVNCFMYTGCIQQKVKNSLLCMNMKIIELTATQKQCAFNHLISQMPLRSSSVN